MMTIVAAREIKDGDIVFCGTGISMLAAMAAKNINAPNSVIFFETGSIDAKLDEIPLAVADPRVMYWSSSNSGLLDAFATMQNRITGEHVIGILGAAQIDKFGNMNSSYIGDPDNFIIRMMGAGGAPEFVGYANRAVLTMRGGEFVEKLDYFTSPGYVEGGTSRYDAGMPEGSGPEILITTKGVFRFDDDSKEMYLAGLHPNMTVEEITKDIPWDLKIADSLETTPLPTPEELDIIRRFAPEISMGRKLQIETIGARIGRLFAKIAEGHANDE